MAKRNKPTPAASLNMSVRISIAKKFYKNDCGLHSSNCKPAILFALFWFLLFVVLQLFDSVFFEHSYSVSVFTSCTISGITMCASDGISFANIIRIINIGAKIFLIIFNGSNHLR